MLHIVLIKFQFYIFDIVNLGTISCQLKMGLKENITGVLLYTKMLYDTF